MLSHFLGRSKSPDRSRPPSPFVAQAKASLDIAHRSIPPILKIANTERCSVLLAVKNERAYASYRTTNTGDLQQVTTSDDGLIFQIASMSKPFIAVAVGIMIHHLSHDDSPENKRYRELQGAWDKSFTEIFNKYREKDCKISPLQGDPSIRHLTVHHKGSLSMNHRWSAPDGRPLLSKENFLKTMPQYTQDTSPEVEGWVAYSNANYIMLALLIEEASGMELHEFLQKYLFGPLHMSRTFMSSESLQSHLQSNPGTLAQPHVVSSSRHRYAIPFDDNASYLRGIIEKTILGTYSCVADLGLFFTALMLAGTDSQVHKYFDKTLLHEFRHLMGEFDNKKNGYMPLGLYTSLDEKFVGSLSSNRSLSPKSDLSNYTIGTTAEGSTFKAYYLAGSSTGWACTGYFLRREKIFVIVLTNTSGPLDSSDLISRLCLQQILHLTPSKFDQPGYIYRPANWEQIDPIEWPGIFHVELAHEMFRQNALDYKKHEEADSITDAQTPDRPGVCGNYIDEKSCLSLKVYPPKISDLDRALRIVINDELGPYKKSSELRFVWTGTTFRICSLQEAGQACRGLCIDCFGEGDWSNLDFIPDSFGHVKSLTRVGKLMDDCYIRKDN